MKNHQTQHFLLVPKWCPNHGIEAHVVRYATMRNHVKWYSLSCLSTLACAAYMRQIMHQSGALLSCLHSMLLTSLCNCTAGILINNNFTGRLPQIKVGTRPEMLGKKERLWNLKFFFLNVQHIAVFKISHKCFKIWRMRCDHKAALMFCKLHVVGCEPSMWFNLMTVGESCT